MLDKLNATAAGPICVEKVFSARVFEALFPFNTLLRLFDNLTQEMKTVGSRREGRIVV